MQLRKSRRLAFLLFSLAAVSSFRTATTGAASAETYELRGTLVHPDGRSYSAENTLASLYGVRSPFLQETQVDRAGRFRFRKLPPGLYSLVITVPDRGQLRRTVEVNSILAGKDGRQEIVVPLDPSTGLTNTVSATQLAVPAKAQKRCKRPGARWAKGTPRERSGT